MSYNTIHETVIQDVVDVMKDGIEAADTTLNPSGAPAGLTRAGSLTKATSGLTLVFPVLVDSGLPIDTAAMVTKAVERKAVSLLQIAFSAFNITNSKDAYEFIKTFHTNVHSKMTMDEFIDAMDSLSEQVEMPREDRRKYNAVMEDLKKNCGYYLGEDICETSINDYKVLTKGIGYSIVKEELDEDLKDFYKQQEYEDRHQQFMNNDEEYRDRLDRRHLDNERETQRHQWAKNSDERDEKKYQLDKDKWEEDQRRDKRDYQMKNARNNIQNSKDNFEMLKNQLLTSDVKKANEMVPSMMIVNFYTTDEKTQAVISRQMVIGVKARMIPVNPEDVANKLVSKYADSNMLLKFIKATTREISFAKDFILALDSAKLNAVANSKKGSSTYRYLKVLERRALRGKIRKTLKLNNAFKAISTLVISKETAEYIRRFNNFDVLNPSTIRPIMEKLNLMMFIVADESEESVSIIMDTGDDTYELYSYTSLERESSDGSYKKAINLMTKVVR